MTSRVLVVEDEPDVGNLLCQILEMYGYECTGSLLGLEAIRILGEFDPTVVILDLMLPDIDGFEVCRRIKQAHGDAVGILILTALHASDAREKAFHAGADRFLSKPFIPQDIIQQVESISQELKTDTPAGLRGELNLQLAEFTETEESLEVFVQDLFRSTPLPAQAIAETKQAFYRMADVVQRPENRSWQQVRLACQVFRDRLEHTLRIDQQRADHTLTGQDLYRQLFGSTSEGQTPALASLLGSSIWLAEDRPEMVLTRTFA